MKQFSRLLLGFSLVGTCASLAAAPEKPAAAAALPKVLTISREFVKAGKAGMVHDKAESAFVDAMARAKWPGMADGELLESLDQGVFLLNEQMSLRPRADLSAMRYLEALIFHVRPSKNKEWGEVMKIVKGGYEKGMPEVHWGRFYQLYGGNDGAYIALNSHKSLSEIDMSMANDKKFLDAVGEEGMKKLNDLYGVSVESLQHQLIAFNPKMSYVQDGWIKADPGFSKPKAAVPAAKARAEDKKANP